MELFTKIVGDGKPLIILHGLLGSSDNWLPIARKLEDQFKIYLVDLRNHGKSPHSDEWSLDSMSKDVYELISNHNLESPALLGHSMGGKVAMQLATEKPDLLSKLIVVDIAPKYYPIHHQDILKGLNAIPISEIDKRSDADKALADYVPQPGVRQFLLKNLTRTENGFKWKMNLKTITEKIENVGKEISGETQFLKPSLFIRGEKSDYVLDSDISLINKYFPNNTIQSVNNAGHWVHAEKPEEVVNSIRSFLS